MTAYMAAKLHYLEPVPPIRYLEDTDVHTGKQKVIKFNKVHFKLEHKNNND